MSIRLTTSHRQAIVENAVNESLADKELDQEIEMAKLMDKVYWSRVTKKDYEAFENLPIGTMTKSKKISFVTDSLEISADMSEERWVPVNLLGDSYLKLDPDLVEEIREVAAQGVALGIVRNDRCERLRKEVIDQFATVTGLLTKWPDAIDFLPNELTEDMEVRELAESILTV